MSGNCLPQRGLKRALALVLTVALIFGGFGFSRVSVDHVYAGGGSNNAALAEASLMSAVNYYSHHRNWKIDEWEELLAIYGATILPGSDVDLQEWQLPDISALSESSSHKDYLPVIITSLIKGMNPADVVSNLVEKADENQFSDKADVQAYSMLGVEIGRNEGIVISNDYDGSEAARHLADLQDEETGGFTGEHDGGCITNDTTGIVALALAPYVNETELQTSVSAIVNFFEEEQLVGGGFKYYYAASQWGPAGSYESANSTALAVWGLSAIKSKTHDMALKSQIDTILSKALPALIQWQNSDGSFGFSPSGQGEFDSLTSRQVMIALYAIAADEDIFAQIQKNEKELVSCHIRIESNLHLPIDTNISMGKGETLERAGEISWRKLEFPDGFSSEAYNYLLDHEQMPGGTTIADEGSEILLIGKGVTTRSTFEQRSLTGELNQSQTVVLKDPTTGEPLSGIVITIDGNQIGFSALTTDENGLLTIPADEFLEARTYQVSIDVSGVSKDLCIITVNKGETESKTVSVRIEGIDKNIVNEPQVTVTTTGEKALTAYDAMAKALDDKGIGYAVYSGWIASIADISDNYFELSGMDYDYWNFYVNNQYSNYGIASYVISDGDELLFFYGNANTVLPMVAYTIEEETLTVKLTAAYYDWETNEYITTKIAGAAVTLSKEGESEAFIELTDASGIAVFSDVTTGTYLLKIEKFDTTVGKEGLYLPTIVRSDHTIKIFEETVIDSDAQTVDLTGIDSSVPQSITVPSGVVAPRIQVTADQELPEIQIISHNAADIQVTIPQGTSVTSSDTNWDGIIELPTLTTINLPDKTVETAFSVGSGERRLDFDKPVRLLLPGAGNHKVGYIDGEGDLQEITTALTGDSLSHAEAKIPSIAGEGKIKADSDMAIWTNHFTTFVAYTDDTSGPGGGSETNRVNLQVIGYNGKNAYNILNKTNITIENNDTAYSILAKAGLTATMSGGYVSAINGLEEKEFGPGSGWKYSVNNVYPSASALSYRLKSGDSVIWRYVLDPEEGEKNTDNLPAEELLSDNEAAAAASAKFSDVSDTDWFAPPVGYLTNLGVLKGRTETTFKPYDNITRAELASVLARMSGADLTAYETVEFEDVDVNSWYGPSVAWAKEMGIVSGYANQDGSASFRPDAKISRQEIAVMLHNYNEKVAKKTYEEAAATAFTDYEQIAEYAKSAVKAMQHRGIINGMKNADGSFRFQPLGNATRAEAAMMIYNMLKTENE